MRIAISQQVLTVGAGGLRKFSVKFKSLPDPSQVQGLDHFKIHVVSKETGPIGLVKKKSVWKTKRQEASVAVSNLSKVDWEEGWHYVRITAHNENGDPIPLVDTVGDPLPWDSGSGPDDTRRINESDEFYVFKGQDIDIEPTQRAVPRYPSLMHALVDKQFSALSDQRSLDEIPVTKVAWLQDETAPELKGQDILEVKLGREGTCHVPVSSKLKDLEQKILASPRGPISWRLPIAMGVARDAVNDLCRWPDGELVESFLAARTAYFAALSAQQSMLVSQAADFRQLDSLVCEYAERYLKLIQSFSRRAETGQGPRIRSRPWKISSPFCPSTS